VRFIRRHVTFLVLLLLIFAVVALLLYPIFARSRGSRIDACAAHLQMLGVGMQTYAADYDGRLPNALTWPADLRPYVQDDRFLHCPEDQRKGERSYEMLQRWSYQRLPEAKSDRVILLYEIGKYGPEYRHYDSMYIGHGDGHVKLYAHAAMTPEVILSGKAP
jgi:hypothetical protein